jgi:hypothetical protein
VGGDRKRQAASSVVLGLYRLIKACLLYNDTNQAITSIVPAAANAVVEYCAAVDSGSVRVLFGDPILFVNRRILRTSREIALIGVELGALFERAGFTEVGIEKTVKREAMLAFARFVADAQREANPRELGDTIDGIQTRRVRVEDAGVLPEAEGSTVLRVVQSYAAAVLLMRHCFEGFSSGDLEHDSRAKRVAQKLVAIGEQDGALLSSLATAPFPDPDPARIAVSTAVIAGAMARQITSDRLVISSVVTAGLLLDIGRIRLGGIPFAERIAASTLVALTSLGKLQQPTILRGVIAYEAQRLAHGPPFEGAEQPNVLSRLVHVARKYNDLRTPSANGAPAGIDAAIEILNVSAESPVERACVGLLVSGLGLFALGTLVELSTGELAVVVGAPHLSIDFAKAPVQVLTDAKGNVLPTPMQLDLTKRTGATIRRAIAADPSQLGAIRGLVSRS